MNLDEFSKKTIKEIKSFIVKNSFDAEILALIKQDSRAGVQKIYQQIQSKKRRELKEKERVQSLFLHERSLEKLGKKYIAGIDEVGRGPLAGPVVAAAVILPQNIFLEGLNDSKKLSAAKREQLTLAIKGSALAWAIAEASVEEIFSLNIYRASLLAMKRAVEKLQIHPDHLLIDAVKIPDINLPQTPLINGDSISASIAAASIIAKTFRDQMMQEYHQQYPQYGFDQHKGYPTANHIQALENYGPCIIHRRGFGPVKNVISKGSFD